MRDLKLPLNDVKDLKKDSLAYHLLHQDKVHGIHKFWRSIASEDVGLPVIKIDDYMPRWWRGFVHDKQMMESIRTRLLYATGQIDFARAIQSLM